MFQKIHSKRLSFRALEVNDAQGFYEYMAEPQNYPYAHMTPYTAIEQALYYIQIMNDGMNQEKWLIWAITLTSTDVCIGTISIWNFNETKQEAELGFGLYPAFRGQGYMQETIQRICEYAFCTLKMCTIYIYTPPHHEDAIQCAIQNQFTYLKTVEEDSEIYEVYQLKKTEL